MGERTGKPRGRPKGAKNKRTEERQAALQQAAVVIEQALPQAFHGDSHALLMQIYKDENRDIALRLDAAKAAIGYEKPRLAAVDVKAEVDATVEVSRIELVAPAIVSDDHPTH